MRILAIFLVVAVAVPEPDRPVPKDARTVQDHLQGEWIVDKLERDGRETPREKIQDYRFVFNGESLTLIESKMRFSNGSFSLDEKKNPTSIDIKLDHKSGRKIVLEGIIEIQGNKAKLCYVENGRRPAEFAAPAGNSDVRLFFLTRLQDAPASPLIGKRFLSLEKLPGGDRADGTVSQINWVIQFKDRTFTWHHHDTLITGTYQFDAATGAIKTNDAKLNASFDARTGTLTWDKHQYRAAKDAK